MRTSLVRAAVRTLGIGVSAAVAVGATAGSAPALASMTAPRQIAVEVSLVGVTRELAPGIVESPTTLGVADSALYTQTPDVVTKTLDELQALGVRDIRVAVPWVYIESTRDQYDWSQMDFVVREANARGINVVGVVSATPTWAGFPLNGHSDPADYAEFVAAVADRYDGVLDEGEDQTHGRISAYEIWNEPNGALFYNPVSAAAYTEMLKAAAPKIRAADPDATVIAGVLGAVRTIAGLSLSPVTFVEQMYANGAGTDCAGGCFDALSYHPYQYTLPFSRGGDQTDSPINQVAAIRALMAAHGDEAKKIWATEYGLPTNGIVSEREQADFIRDFMVAWQKVDGAGPAFVYTTRDSRSGGFDDEENFGIFFTDWDEKAAVDVLRALYADIAEDGDLDDTYQAPPPSTSFFEQLILVGKQITNLLLMIPRAIAQAVVSAVNAVVETIKSLLGINRAAAAPDESDIARRASSVPDTVDVDPEPEPDAGPDDSDPPADEEIADAVEESQDGDAIEESVEVTESEAPESEDVATEEEIDPAPPEDLPSAEAEDEGTEDAETVDAAESDQPSEPATTPEAGDSASTDD